MAYCPNCAREMRAAPVEFCSNCGHRLRADTETVSAPLEQPPSSPDASATAASSASLNLDDVPAWLGWLAILNQVTFWFIPIYWVWAYRRGRKDGVGRETSGQPYTNMAGTTVGWALAHVVPLLSWYALVHLPTLWYKHGLRVGAKEGAASTRFTSVPAFLCWPLLVIAPFVALVTVFAVVAFLAGVVVRLVGG